ncbi:subclass B1 metallo-beta-lactamase [Aquimarina sp. AU474]|uniref:subclass B1 metallo-beta-lactamase n=1 Tax=Aquimarina sp. AU474 TaxID=2108529 RepID=UPI000D68714B|nr:subclass B1 metallo-beta-lactamase [Aquimarina sp. AU474]
MTKTLSKLLTLVSFSLLLYSCNTNKEVETIEISEDLQLIKINDHSYIHISEIYLESGNKFPSNGFVYINNSEAYVFDTPANDKATIALINWLQNTQKVTIKGVIFNHFHRDCIEGMDIFKSHDIPCIASGKTLFLMNEAKSDTPDRVFENRSKLKLGNKTIINTFFGEAHTSDNIISYFPEEEIIFGGCMIKSLDAKKGNLADANISQWSETVSKIKKEHPNVKVVIPGHGKHGGQDLLDYTIALFNTQSNK